MQMKEFGNTGLKVSQLGLGAWPIGNNGIGEYGYIDENEAIEMLNRYLDLGGNFIDTARAYGERSERLIGQAVSNRQARSEVIIASKTVAGETADSIPEMRKDLEESLRLLQTDYIDIYQLHQPPESPEVMERTLYEMERFRDEGKIRFIGASIKGPNVNDYTVELCQRYMNTGRIAGIQVVYSILRQKLGDVISEARRKGIGVIVRTALESGLLTGAYKPGHVFTGKDQRLRYNKERLDYILESVDALRREIALSPPYDSLAEIAIQFSAELEGVSTVIVGAQNPQEIERNVATIELPALNPELVVTLKRMFDEKTELANYS